MAVGALIDAPDLAMALVVVPSRPPESGPRSPRLACQSALPGVSSGGYGAFQRARDGRDCGHAITCAVMSLIAGGTSVMDLIHCDEFIA